MSYDIIKQTACVPVFIPKSLLNLNVPEEMMMWAIEIFNERIKTDPLEFQHDNKIKAKVIDLIREGDDLFLRIKCFDDDGYKLDDWSATMIGYIVMNKNTGEVGDLVIEGFKWVRRKSLTSSP